jgi:hypothetical protein
MPDLLDRTYVSQFSTDTLGIEVHRAGALGDADGDDVTATLTRPDETVAFTRPATRLSLGRYGVTLSSAESATPGMYLLSFDYTVDGDPSHYEVAVEVGSAAPAYDALPPGFKDVVEQVWVRFADCFDSVFGGPYLQEKRQARFDRQRVAQLLRQAVGRMNTLAQPHGSFAVDANFPFAPWGGIAEQALYVETLKHLMRSYVEQPEVILGTSVSRLDRKDYLDRWKQIYDIEKADLDEQFGLFKMSYMGLGNVSVLVSGGAFGNWGPMIAGGGMGEAAARGYFFARWH